MQNTLLAVSAPPFWHSGRTLEKNMRWMLLALMPAAIMAVFNWGVPALRVMALACATAVAAEALAARLMNRQVYVNDGNALVIGLLFSFLLPSAAPWWLVMFGSAVSVLIGKMAFGGVGASPLCAPVVGWAALFLSWPLLMDANLSELSTAFTDPLARLRYFGVYDAMSVSMKDLLLGKQIGALGASQPAALALGGFFLCAMGVIRWEIPASFLAGVAATAALFEMFDSSLYVGPDFHLLTGSVMLGAFFLATDYSSSPNRIGAMAAYGLIGGVMTILIRNFGVYGDGVPFAILLINLLMPQLELIRYKPFGVR